MLFIPSRPHAYGRHELFRSLYGGVLLMAAPMLAEAQEQPPDPTAELCPEGAPDADGDRLCDAAEARYQTNPNLRDTDGDALSDADELFGMWVEGASDDGSPQKLDLAALGASPLRRDVFVEVDYYPGHKPQAAALDMVRDAFAAAAVKNPDGSTGISFHYLIDDEIAAADAPAILGDPAAKPEETVFPCPQDTACNPEEDLLEGLDIYAKFDPIKAKYSSPLRHGAYHYALYAAQMTHGALGISFHINAHDFAIALDHPSVVSEAGTFMHEFGHNLGLKHGGDEHVNWKLNYFSVMNYTYVEGVLRDGARVLDYARHPIAAVLESAIDEHQGFAPGPGATEKDLERYGVIDFSGSPIMGNASVDLDINSDGMINPAPYDWDFNGDGDHNDEIWRATRNDWEALKYDARGSIGNSNSWFVQQSRDQVMSNPPCTFKR